MSEKIFFCPTCGLGLKNPIGEYRFYCPDCGGKVTIDNDAKTSFSKRLLDAPADVLFARSHKGERNDALLIEAANKGNIDAMLELGATYCTQKNFDKALPMLKKAADLGDAYAICLYVTAKIMCNYKKYDFSRDELKELVEMLEKVPGCVEQWATLYDFLCKIKEEQEEAERERKRSSYSTSLSYSNDTYNTSSYGSSSYQPGGGMLSSRDRVRQIISDPNLTSDEKLRAVKEHNEYYIDDLKYDPLIWSYSLSYDPDPGYSGGSSSSSTGCGCGV